MRLVPRTLSNATVLIAASVALAATDAAALHLWGPGGRGHPPSPNAAPPVPVAAPAPAPMVEAAPAPAPAPMAAAAPAPAPMAAPAAAPKPMAAPPPPASAMIEDIEDMPPVKAPPPAPKPAMAATQPSAAGAASMAPGSASDSGAPVPAAPKPKRKVVSADRLATDKASEEIRREQLERLSKAAAAAGPNVKVQSSPGAAKE